VYGRKQGDNATVFMSMTGPSASGDPRKIPNDAELLGQTGHGNEAAFRELINRHGRYLYGIANSLSGNAADADDLVQETLIGALNSRFRGESSVRTWLVGILVRQAGMLRRKKQRQARPLSPFGNRGESGAGGPELQTTSQSPGGTDAKLDLALMLERLSPEHREVIILRELEGMAYEEIAAALGVPRGTVESRLHRAREELRKRFKGYLP
jgi:RNA polymerase sigma-70 factor (ECF subfamily)